MPRALPHVGCCHSRPSQGEVVRITNSPMPIATITAAKAGGARTRCWSSSVWRRMQAGIRTRCRAASSSELRSARALAIRPKVLLLDEPLSALDAKVRRQLREEIRRIQIAVGTTTLFVTYDQEEALALGDRIGVMSAGRLEQIASPTELNDRPRNWFVAEFVGLTNRISGVATRDEVELLGSRVPLLEGSAGPGSVIALVCPESVQLTAEPGANARVAGRELSGLDVPDPGCASVRRAGRGADGRIGVRGPPSGNRGACCVLASAGVRRRRLTDRRPRSRAGVPAGSEPHIAGPSYPLSSRVRPSSWAGPPRRGSAGRQIAVDVRPVVGDPPLVRALHER